MKTCTDGVKQGQSVDLSRMSSDLLRRELKETRKRFEVNGGRGVDDAEFIDNARFELRSRAARKAALTRKEKR